MRPPNLPLPHTHIRQHNLLDARYVQRISCTILLISFLFNFYHVHKITTQAELTNGVRHADPPDHMDDVLEVLMKNGGECLLKLFNNFQDNMVLIDMDIWQHENQMKVESWQVAS